MNRIFIYLTVAAITSLASCSNGDTDNNRRLKRVHTTTVTDENGTGPMTYIGKAVPSKELSLSFKVAGKIQKINVAQGSVVKAGQLIAEIDPVDYTNQLTATEAEYNQIKAEVDRIVAMHGDGAVSDNNYDKAVYGLRQITAKYEQHKAELSYTKLYAPFSGQISETLAEAGEVVGAGMPVAMMIGAGVPEIEIHVAAAVLPLLRQGNISATFQTLGNDVIPLDIVSVSPTANASQLYSVKLRMPADAAGIIPGMTATVSIAGADITGSMRIPSGAVSDNYVLRLNPSDSTVSRVAVSISKLLPGGDCIITSDGLHTGDILIAAGMRKLSDGEKVCPVAPVSETNKGGLL